MRKIFLSLIALSLILNLKAQNKNDKAEVFLALTELLSIF